MLSEFEPLLELFNDSCEILYDFKSESSTPYLPINNAPFLNTYDI